MSNEQSQVNTEPAPANAKELIATAMKEGRARGKFKSVDEVVAEGKKAGEKEPTDNKAEIKASTELESPLPEEINIEVDDTGSVSSNEPGQSQVETKKEETETEKVEASSESSGSKIKIGDREFTNETEAITYAQELESQRVVDEAFRQGIEAAQNLTQSNLNPQVQTKAPEPEVIPDIYYTNPAAYFKQREAELVAKITQNVSSQAESQKKHETTMNKFWNDYPDLAKSQAAQKLTGRVLNENFESLRNVPTEKALKIIAEKARAELKELGVTTLPTKVIPSSTKPIASSGTSTTVKRPVVEEKALNFIQQMRSMKNKKAEARRSR